MALAGLIDPTKTGKYPVILGDSLLVGKDANEIFTGIRYNHKPALSSASAPSSARLKPSVPGKTTSYDLTYTDDDGKYSFSGPRNTADSQYVLYFDPAREAFILDKVDSTFNMNVIQLPDNPDTEGLRRRYPQIDNESQAAPKASSSKLPNKPAAAAVEKPASKPAPKPASKPAPKPRAKPTVQKKEVKRKPEKKQPPKSIALSLPVPEPSKPQPESQPKRSSQDEDEDDDEDDDGGLLVEYPGADPRNNARQTNFSPAFPSVRRFDDFMNQRESEGDDADGESDDEPDMDFKLPSPVNHPMPQSAPEPMDEDEDDGGADLEDDLEKEMEIAFEDLENSQEGSPDGDESEISEED
ncbi:RNA polymerase II transcription elongation factor-domain-containing protein [Dactylonectria estremocensis]|uniref:RNA polymerase II transcription elongation factor-domain-containing protein n=1 Tax=Dactylonectria estremocensis TaxID=1079267 RepID=A0A9P9FC85_9HYPO|nr:RNA polymerase II transcription elongation factor-domain-containing protein [Dactylonectria estremocensis]